MASWTQFKINNSYTFGESTLNRSLIGTLLNKKQRFEEIEESVSSGRKIFRFLRWIEDFNEIYKLLNASWSASRNGNILLHGLGAVFNFLDNLVFLSSVNLITQVSIEKLKFIKDCVSLVRNFIKVSMDIYKLVELYGELKSYQGHSSTEYNELIQDEQACFEKISKKYLDILHNFFRMTLLVYEIKMPPFYGFCHYLFIGFAGLMHSLIAIFKKGRASRVEQATRTNNNCNTPSMLDLQFVQESYDRLNLTTDEVESNYYIDFNKTSRVKNYGKNKTLNLNLD